MAHGSNGCAGLVALLMVLFFCHTAPAKAISCTETLQYLMPCQPFLTGIGDINVPCCQGAQALSQATAASQADRRSVCQCLKQAAASVNVNQDRAKQLPQLCNVNVPVPIQPDVDCNTVQFSVGLNRH